MSSRITRCAVLEGVEEDSGEEMHDHRLALLKEARRQSGMSLDFWEDLTQDLDDKALESLVGRSSIFPKYRNSKGKP